MYVPPALMFSHPSFYTLHMVRKTPRRDVLTLLCSLLNTVMNASTPSNITIASVAGKVPYNHLVFKREDSRTALVGMCLQVLCVLLDFQSGPARDVVVSGNGENASFVPTQTNAFRYFLAKLVCLTVVVVFWVADRGQASNARFYFHSRWHHQHSGATTRCVEQPASWFQKVGTLCARDRYVRTALTGNWSDRL